MIDSLSTSSSKIRSTVQLGGSPCLVSLAFATETLDASLKCFPPMLPSKHISRLLVTCKPMYQLATCRSHVDALALSQAFPTCFLQTQYQEVSNGRAFFEDTYLCLLLFFRGGCSGSPKKGTNCNLANYSWTGIRELGLPRRACCFVCPNATHPTRNTHKFQGTGHNINP